MGLFKRKKKYVGEQRALAELRDLLLRSPVTWTDAEIARIAASTDLSVEELTDQRAKLDGAGRWGAEGLEALEKYIQDSGREAELRKLLEIPGPVKKAAEVSRTFAGVFPSTYREIERINAQLGESTDPLLVRQE